jgi:hypothetical protein
MRKTLRLLVLAVVVALGALTLTTPASAAAPYCGITWGSLAKGDRQIDPGAGLTVSGVRAGRHSCYDRLVVDLKTSGYTPSWRVEYVSAVSEDASGRPVPLRGGADLLVTVGASDHTVDGRPTYTPANRRELANVSGFRTFRQVAYAGSFEGVTSFGVGVRARTPFRAFLLEGSAAGKTRLVIDVAHRW